MSKSISSYPMSMQKIVVTRRLNNNTQGLGFLAAKDSMRFMSKQEAIKVASKVPIISNEEIS